MNKFAQCLVVRQHLDQQVRRRHAEVKSTRLGTQADPCRLSTFVTACRSQLRHQSILHLKAFCCLHLQQDACKLR